MPHRRPKDLAVRLDEDDILWGRLHGINFSEIFGEYLRMVRRETEVAAYALLTTPSRRESQNPLRSQA